MNKRSWNKQPNMAAEKKLTAIILGAFPDMGDRSEAMTDHSDFRFTIAVKRPGEGRPAPRALPPKEGAAEPAREEDEPTYAPGTEEAVVAPARGKLLGNAADVWTECRDLVAEEREHFVVFFTNVRHRILGERWTCAIGTVCGVEVSPREIYREALARNAVRLIVAHNHPSGDPTPSGQDVELTSRIRKAGEMLGLELLDHIIVGAEGFVSLASRGWVA
jgi:DNA repair protein RadC